MCSANKMLFCYRKGNREKQTIAYANCQTSGANIFGIYFGDLLLKVNVKCQDQPLLGRAVVSSKINTYSSAKTDQGQKIEKKPDKFNQPANRSSERISVTNKRIQLE